MKLSIAIFTVLFGIFAATAQDYQTVKSSFQHYFIDENGDMLGLEPTHSDLVNEDSVIYNFKTFRFGYTEPCTHLPFADSWLGRKVIVKPNGWNYFFNKTLDTIKINTNAAIGESWNMYELSSSLYVKATVTGISQQDVFGSQDSIKWFEVAVYNGQGSLVNNDTINGEVYGISKNYGVYKWFDVYQFPQPYSWVSYLGAYNLVGRDNPSEGMRMPTVGEIYDMNVGDEFFYCYSSNSSGVIEMHVLQNRVLVNDTLVHDWTIYKKTTDIFGSTYETSFRADSIANLEMPFDSLMPTKYNSADTLNGRRGYLSYKPSQANGRITSTFEYGYYSDTTLNYCDYLVQDSCYGEYLTDYFERRKSYAVGCGLVYYYVYDSPNNHTWYKKLCGYKKGNEEWGSVYTVSYLTGVAELTDDAVAIYPNPTKDLLIVSFDGGYTLSEVFYEVIGIDGRVLQTEVIKGEKGLNIDVSALVSGLYLVRTKYGEVEILKKFVKE